MAASYIIDDNMLESAPARPIDKLLKNKNFIASLILIAITFITLSPVLLGGFTNWDDPQLVTGNARITTLSFDSVKVMFTSFQERLYFPLVTLSYAVEKHFAGLNPLVFHATNLTLHLANTLLVFWLIYLISGGELSVAFITALLFGIHPLHVEPVAWVSERKGLLYAFFFLISIISYIYSDRAKEKNLYYASMFSFLLSLLSKSVAVVLPFVLLLCDHAKKKKIDREDVLNMLPYFALSLLFIFVTMLAHFQPGIKGNEFHFSFIGNTVLAAQNIVFYLIKLALPFKLSAYYPMPDKIRNIPQIIFFLSPLIVLALLALTAYSIKLSGKIFFGAAFFFITIAPVCQFLPLGLGIPADRYTYIPYVGLFYLIAITFSWAYQRYDKKYLNSLLAALVLILSVISFQRALVWRDSLGLWNDVLKNYNVTALPYYNRAEVYLFVKHDFNSALDGFNKAIELDPAFVPPRVNRGLVYSLRNDQKKAIDEYNKALKLSPDTPSIYLLRGNAYTRMGKLDLALADFNRALNIEPGYMMAWHNRGNIHLARGQLDEAVYDYSRSIQLSPADASSYIGRGSAYFKKKEWDAAFNDFSTAAMMDETTAVPYLNMALLLARKGKNAAALDCLDKARSLGGKVDPALYDRIKKAPTGL